MVKPLSFGVAMNITGSSTSLDAQLVLDHMEIAVLAEELGFDSVFCFEHHFSNYILSPAPLQMLSYLAGKTSKIRLGTGVIVLPWNDPVRVAEGISLLEILSQGRGVYGFGRGRRSMEDFHFLRENATNNFVQEINRVRNLVRGQANLREQDAHGVNSIRPLSLSTFDNNFYAATTTVSRAAQLAENQIGLIAPASVGMSRLRDLTSAYSQSSPAVISPIIEVMVCVHSSGQKARAMFRHYTSVDAQIQSAHYGTLEEQVPTNSNQLGLAVVGTPEDCVSQIEHLIEVTGSSELLCEFGFGGMPSDLVRNSLRGFASDVIPRFAQAHCDGDFS